MSKVDEKFNVGSPYVLLTTDEKVTTNSDAQEDPNSVLLTLQEGNLISFSERRVSGEEGDSSTKPSIFMKFLDPEMIFIPRFFDQSFVNLYRNYFNQIREAVGGYITYEELDKIKEVKNETEVEKSMRQLREYRDSRLEGQEFMVDFVPQGQLVRAVGGEYDHEESTNKLYKKRKDTNRKQKLLLDEITKEWNNRIGESLTSFWLTYGDGNGTQAAWRRFVLSSFFISQDSSNNMIINMTASEYPLDNAEFGVMSNSYTLKNFEGGLNNIDNINPNNDVIVPILEISEMSSNKPRINHNTGVGASVIRNWFRTSLHWISEIVSYEEDLVLSLLENLYQKFLKTYSGKGVLPFVFLSPKIPSLLKTKIDEILENTLKEIGQVGTHLETVMRFQILQSILNSCDITTRRSIPAVSPTPDVADSVIYYLTILKESTVTAEDTVLNSIRNLYTYLGISEGGYPMDNVDYRSLVISNEKHKRLFLKQFCVFDKGEYKNTYIIRKDVQEKLGVKVKDSEINKYIIIVYTDYVLGNGLIIPFSPGYSNEILKIYTERLKIPFKDSPVGVMNSNAYKFLYGNEDITKYIREVSEIYDINSHTKTTFDYSNEVNELKKLESLPIFIANRKNSNVFDVVSTEKTTGFGNLLSQFELMQKGAEITLSSILSNPLEEQVLDFSPEKFDRSIESFLEKAYKNNAASHTLLLALGEFTDNDNVDETVKKLFKSIKTETRSMIESSNYVTDRKINYLGLTAHLNYIQSLSNTAATVSVKTVPFFNLHFPIILGKPCLFLNNTSFHALTRGIPIAGYLSGVYLVSGYEHFISDSECYSKFTIQRQKLLTDTVKSLHQS